LDTTTDDGDKIYIKKFDNDTFDKASEQPKEPYRYGSYFIYEADKTTM